MRRSLCLEVEGAECSCIVLVSEALPLLGGWGVAECSCMVLVSEALPLLLGGGAECSCIELVSEAFPLLGGGRQNVHVLY